MTHNLPISLSPHHPISPSLHLPITPSARILHAAALLTALLLSPLSARAADLAKARSLLMHGRYEEAAEIYKPAAATSDQAALGFAACLESQGKTDEAVEALKPLAGKHADMQAELARMALERGDVAEARLRVDAALTLASEHPLATYVRAELAAASGRIDAAEKDYRRLVQFYNSHDVNKAESLRWIGRAAAQYARWNRLSDQFDSLVNDLLPSALKLDPDYWPAHYEAGLLFMEKYNNADAAKEFQLALEINPRAAEVHAALAELAMKDFRLEQAEASLREAMAINPRLPEAWQLTADVAWLNDRTEPALQLLREKLLPLNPLDESTLARIAACYLALDDAPGKPASTRFDALRAEVDKRNPHAGEFYTELAAMLEIRNKQSAAERYYREAIRVLPRQPEAHAGLGLLMMRIGRETEARKLLQAAFDADPFHIRVKNSLDVLDVLDAMQSKATPHFVIKYDKTDARLVPYLARRLETAYPEVREQFGYEPPGPTPVEIFNESHGQSGHAWFSARMTGLPYLETVAASTGRIVALVSPGETRSHGSFNWARTLKHEMVHVFNLQQTGYNIPHWFTEGLAVYDEKIQRPYRWTLLLRRRAKAHKLMDLNSINAGFARAMSGDDCNLAYCQAELYVEYMIDRGGGDAPRKMVAAYAKSLSTEAAVGKVFGVSQEEFEHGYGEFLEKQIRATPVLEVPEETPVGELEALHRRQPKDAQAAARLALAYCQRGASQKAEDLAAEALKLQPKQPLATYVLVRVRKAFTRQEAMEILEGCTNRNAPEPLSLGLLAGMKLKAGKYEEAAALYSLGEQFDPANPQWTASLARVYLASGQKQNLARTLARFARTEPDDLPSRKKLAELALEERDAAAARRWATEALEIQVEDGEVHRLLASALVELDELEPAIEEFEIAIDLNPGHNQQRFALADALVQARQPAKARKVLEELLRRDPKYPGADTLLESLGKKQ
jgi:cellulose synthase operon protein C